MSYCAIKTISKQVRAVKLRGCGLPRMTEGGEAARIKWGRGGAAGMMGADADIQQLRIGRWNRLMTLRSSPGAAESFSRHQLPQSYPAPSFFRGQEHCSRCISKAGCSSE